MGKRALICGISGQDGTYLAKLLLDRGYEVWGSSRDAELATFNNLRHLGIYESVQLVSLNLRDVGSVLSLLRRIHPDQIFSLAGQSSVGLSFEQPVETIESIALGALSLLEAIRLSDLDIRLYNASAYWTVTNYRQAYGMFACTGILSNHDSPLRPRRFVTRKIIYAVASLALGREVRLSLGNLNIERDWGWAPEYVEAIAAMLDQPSPTDYIIATGTSHTLQQFMETAFELVDNDWRAYVTIDEHLMRPTDILRNKVDPSKAAECLGWKATNRMKQVVSKMLEAEMANLRREKMG